MKIRGTRECQNCGTQWSYYDTGSVTCPTCESMQSVGLEDDRVQHTDSAITLDLTEAQEAVDERPLREVSTLVADTAREYVTKRGFIKGGELQPLDDTYLVAQELRHIADVFSRALEISDDEELYFLSLLRGAEAGERPATMDVPDSLHEVRTLADSESLREYHDEMGEWVREHDVSREGRNTLETLGEHIRRARALEGGLDIDTADALVSSARDLARYFREGDEDALVSTRDTLGRIE
ncbi:hypothetical protein SAMN05421858_1925 [Haladaptatus litoreus]|uniref:TFIIB-type zinc ribbon-containing protein n=1 Tax=Haladaptatus litoreus TaxID=553468 RepID=A0A1N6Z8Y4_9EURY|nr:hypothetical protein [Haladaptatus litoreus]SIR23275.1 hypothetical protein SAMN05421858_1925 [Haladaptatus litoreus]